MNSVKNVLGKWGKKVGEATRQAEDLAGNTWQHCEFSSCFMFAFIWFHVQLWIPWTRSFCMPSHYISFPFSVKFALDGVGLSLWPCIYLKFWKMKFHYIQTAYMHKVIWEELRIGCSRWGESWKVRLRVGWVTVEAKLIDSAWLMLGLEIFHFLVTLNLCTQTYA